MIASLNTHSRSEAEFDLLINRAAGGMSLVRHKSWLRKQGSAVLEIRLEVACYDSNCTIKCLCR